MALLIPSIADPRDPARPVADAYAWLSSLSLDLGAGTGLFRLTVNPSEAAWAAQPITTLPVELGRNGCPTLAELMADPAFAQAYSVIGQSLYRAAIAACPELAGAALA